MNKKNLTPYLPYVIVAVCVAAILGMGYRSLAAYKERNAGLLKVVADQKKNIEQHKAVIDKQNKTISQQNITISKQNQIVSGLASKCDQLLNNQQPKQQPVPAAAELEPLPEEDNVQDVLQPVVQPTDDESTQLDALKKRYEEILVTYFVLKKCNKVQVTDYHVITSAMAQEMASLDAPGRLQNDILTSAQGSYQELYSNSPCDEDTVAPMQAQYKAFIDAVATQFTPQ